jgi:hypothetical protein
MILPWWSMNKKYKIFIDLVMFFGMHESNFTSETHGKIHVLFDANSAL